MNKTPDNKKNQTKVFGDAPKKNSILKVDESKKTRKGESRNSKKSVNPLAVQNAEKRESGFKSSVQISISEAPANFQLNVETQKRNSQEPDKLKFIILNNEQLLNRNKQKSEEEKSAKKQKLTNKSKNHQRESKDSLLRLSKKEKSNSVLQDSSEQSQLSDPYSDANDSRTNQNEIFNKRRKMTTRGSVIDKLYSHSKDKADNYSDEVDFTNQGGNDSFIEIKSTNKIENPSNNKNQIPKRNSTDKIEKTQKKSKDSVIPRKSTDKIENPSKNKNQILKRNSTDKIENPSNDKNQILKRNSTEKIENPSNDKNQILKRNSTDKIENPSNDKNQILKRNSTDKIENPSNDKNQILKRNSTDKIENPSNDKNQILKRNSTDKIENPSNDKNQILKRNSTDKIENPSNDKNQILKRNSTDKIENPSNDKNQILKRNSTDKIENPSNDKNQILKRNSTDKIENPSNDKNQILKRNSTDKIENPSNDKNQILKRNSTDKIENPSNDKNQILKRNSTDKIENPSNDKNQILKRNSTDKIENPSNDKNQILKRNSTDKIENPSNDKNQILKRNSTDKIENPSNDKNQILKRNSTDKIENPSNDKNQILKRNSTDKIEKPILKNDKTKQTNNKDKTEKSILHNDQSYKTKDHHKIEKVTENIHPIEDDNHLKIEEEIHKPTIIHKENMESDSEQKTWRKKNGKLRKKKIVKLIYDYDDSISQPIEDNKKKFKFLKKKKHDENELNKHEKSNLNPRPKIMKTITNEQGETKEIEVTDEESENNEENDQNKEENYGESENENGEENQEIDQEQEDDNDEFQNRLKDKIKFELIQKKQNDSKVSNNENRNENDSNPKETDELPESEEIHQNMKTNDPTIIDDFDERKGRRTLEEDNFLPLNNKTKPIIRVKREQNENRNENDSNPKETDELPESEEIHQNMKTNDPTIIDDFDERKGRRTLEEDNFLPLNNKTKPIIRVKREQNENRNENDSNPKETDELPESEEIHQNMKTNDPTIIDDFDERKGRRTLEEDNFLPLNNKTKPIIRVKREQNENRNENDSNPKETDELPESEEIHQNMKTNDPTIIDDFDERKGRRTLEEDNFLPLNNKTKPIIRVKREQNENRNENDSNPKETDELPESEEIHQNMKTNDPTIIDDFDERKGRRTLEEDNFLPLNNKTKPIIRVKREQNENRNENDSNPKETDELPESEEIHQNMKTNDPTIIDDFDERKGRRTLEEDNFLPLNNKTKPIIRVKREQNENRNENDSNPKETDELPESEEIHQNMKTNDPTIIDDFDERKGRRTLEEDNFLPLNNKTKPIIRVKREQNENRNENDSNPKETDELPESEEIHQNMKTNDPTIIDDFDERKGRRTLEEDNFLPLNNKTKPIIRVKREQNENRNENDSNPKETDELPESEEIHQNMKTNDPTIIDDFDERKGRRTLEEDNFLPLNNKTKPIIRVKREQNENRNENDSNPKETDELPESEEIHQNMKTNDPTIIDDFDERKGRRTLEEDNFLPLNNKTKPIIRVKREQNENRNENDSNPKETDELPESEEIHQNMKTNDPTIIDDFDERKGRRTLEEDNFLPLNNKTKPIIRVKREQNENRNENDSNPKETDELPESEEIHQNMKTNDPTIIDDFDERKGRRTLEEDNFLPLNNKTKPIIRVKREQNENRNENDSNPKETDELPESEEIHQNMKTNDPTIIDDFDERKGRRTLEEDNFLPLNNKTKPIIRVKREQNENRNENDSNPKETDELPESEEIHQNMKTNDPTIIDDFDERKGRRTLEEDNFLPLNNKTKPIIRVKREQNENRNENDSNPKETDELPESEEIHQNMKTNDPTIIDDFDERKGRRTLEEDNFLPLNNKTKPIIRVKREQNENRNENDSNPKETDELPESEEIHQNMKTNDPTIIDDFDERKGRRTLEEDNFLPLNNKTKPIIRVKREQNENRNENDSNPKETDELPESEEIHQNMKTNDPTIIDDFDERKGRRTLEEDNFLPLNNKTKPIIRVKREQNENRNENDSNPKETDELPESEEIHQNMKTNDPTIIDDFDERKGRRTLEEDNFLPLNNKTKPIIRVKREQNENRNENDSNPKETDELPESEEIHQNMKTNDPTIIDDFDERKGRRTLEEDNFLPLNNKTKPIIRVKREQNENRNENDSNPKETDELPESEEIHQNMKTNDPTIIDDFDERKGRRTLEEDNFLPLNNKTKPIIRVKREQNENRNENDSNPKETDELPESEEIHQNMKTNDPTIIDDFDERKGRRTLEEDNFLPLNNKTKPIIRVKREQNENRNENDSNPKETDELPESEEIHQNMKTNDPTIIDDFDERKGRRTLEEDNFLPLNNKTKPIIRVKREQNENRNENDSNPKETDELPESEEIHQNMKTNDPTIIDDFDERKGRRTLEEDNFLPLNNKTKPIIRVKREQNENRNENDSNPKETDELPESEEIHQNMKTNDPTIIDDFDERKGRRTLEEDNFLPLNNKTKPIIRVKREQNENRNENDSNPKETDELPESEEIHQNMKTNDPTIIDDFDERKGRRTLEEDNFLPLNNKTKPIIRVKREQNENRNENDSNPKETDELPESEEIHQNMKTNDPTIIDDFDERKGRRTLEEDNFLPLNNNTKHTLKNENINSNPETIFYNFSDKEIVPHNQNSHEKFSIQKGENDLEMESNKDENIYQNINHPNYLEVNPITKELNINPVYDELNQKENTYIENYDLMMGRNELEADNQLPLKGRELFIPKRKIIKIGEKSYPGYKEKENEQTNHERDTVSPADARMDQIVGEPIDVSKLDELESQNVPVEGTVVEGFREDQLTPTSDISQVLIREDPLRIEATSRPETVTQSKEDYADNRTNQIPEDQSGPIKSTSPLEESSYLPLTQPSDGPVRKVLVKRLRKSNDENGVPYEEEVEMEVQEHENPIQNLSQIDPTIEQRLCQSEPKEEITISKSQKIDENGNVVEEAETVLVRKQLEESDHVPLKTKEKFIPKKIIRRKDNQLDFSHHDSENEQTNHERDTVSPADARMDQIVGEPIDVSKLDELESQNVPVEGTVVEGFREDRPLLFSESQSTPHQYSVPLNPTPDIIFSPIQITTHNSTDNLPLQVESHSNTKTVSFEHQQNQNELFSDSPIDYEEMNNLKINVESNHSQSVNQKLTETTTITETVESLIGVIPLAEISRLPLKKSAFNPVSKYTTDPTANDECGSQESQKYRPNTDGNSVFTIINENRGSKIEPVDLVSVSVPVNSNFEPMKILDELSKNQSLEESHRIPSIVNPVPKTQVAEFNNLDAECIDQKNQNLFNIPSNSNDVNPDSQSLPNNPLFNIPNTELSETEIVSLDSLRGIQNVISPRLDSDEERESDQIQIDIQINTKSIETNSDPKLNPTKKELNEQNPEKNNEENPLSNYNNTDQIRDEDNNSNTPEHNPDMSNEVNNFGIMAKNTSEVDHFDKNFEKNTQMNPVDNSKNSDPQLDSKNDPQIISKINHHETDTPPKNAGQSEFEENFKNTNNFHEIRKPSILKSTPEDIEFSLNRIDSINLEPNDQKNSVNKLPSNQFAHEIYFDDPNDFRNTFELSTITPVDIPNTMIKTVSALINPADQKFKINPLIDQSENHDPTGEKKSLPPKAIQKESNSFNEIELSLSNERNYSNDELAVESKLKNEIRITDVEVYNRKTAETEVQKEKVNSFKNSFGNTKHVLLEKPQLKQTSDEKNVDITHESKESNKKEDIKLEESEKKVKDNKKELTVTTTTEGEDKNTVRQEISNTKVESSKKKEQENSEKTSTIKSKEKDDSLKNIVKESTRKTSLEVTEKKKESLKNVETSVPEKVSIDKYQNTEEQSNNFESTVPAKSSIVVKNTEEQSNNFESTVPAKSSIVVKNTEEQSNNFESTVPAKSSIVVKNTEEQSNNFETTVYKIPSVTISNINDEALKYVNFSIPENSLLTELKLKSDFPKTAEVSLQKNPSVFVAAKEDNSLNHLKLPSERKSSVIVSKTKDDSLKIVDPRHQRESSVKVNKNEETPLKSVEQQIIDKFSAEDSKNRINSNNDSTVNDNEDGYKAQIKSIENNKISQNQPTTHLTDTKIENNENKQLLRNTPNSPNQTNPLVTNSNCIQAEESTSKVSNFKQTPMKVNSNETPTIDLPKAGTKSNLNHNGHQPIIHTENLTLHSLPQKNISNSEHQQIIQNRTDPGKVPKTECQSENPENGKPALFYHPLSEDLPHSDVPLSTLKQQRVIVKQYNTVGEPSTAIRLGESKLIGYGEPVITEVQQRILDPDEFRLIVSKAQESQTDPLQEKLHSILVRIPNRENDENEPSDFPKNLNSVFVLKPMETGESLKTTQISVSEFTENSLNSENRQIIRVSHSPQTKHRLPNPNQQVTYITHTNSPFQKTQLDIRSHQTNNPSYECQLVSKPEHYPRMHQIGYRTEEFPYTTNSMPSNSRNQTEESLVKKPIQMEHQSETIQQNIFRSTIETNKQISDLNSNSKEQKQKLSTPVHSTNSQNNPEIRIQNTFDHSITNVVFENKIFQRPVQTSLINKSYVSHQNDVDVSKNNPSSDTPSFSKSSNQNAHPVLISSDPSQLNTPLISSLIRPEFVAKTINENNQLDHQQHMTSLNIQNNNPSLQRQFVFNSIPQDDFFSNNQTTVFQNQNRFDKYSLSGLHAVKVENKSQLMGSLISPKMSLSNSQLTQTQSVQLNNVVTNQSQTKPSKAEKPSQYLISSIPKNTVPFSLKPSNHSLANLKSVSDSSKFIQSNEFSRTDKSPHVGYQSSPSTQPHISNDTQRVVHQQVHQSRPQMSDTRGLVYEYHSSDQRPVIHEHNPVYQSIPQRKQPIFPKTQSEVVWQPANQQLTSHISSNFGNQHLDVLPTDSLKRKQNFQNQPSVVTRIEPSKIIQNFENKTSSALLNQNVTHSHLMKTEIGIKKIRGLRLKNENIPKFPTLEDIPFYIILNQNNNELSDDLSKSSYEKIHQELFEKYKNKSDDELKTEFEKIKQEIENQSKLFEVEYISHSINFDKNSALQQSIIDLMNNYCFLKKQMNFKGHLKHYYLNTHQSHHLNKELLSKQLNSFSVSNHQVVPDVRFMNPSIENNSSIQYTDDTFKKYQIKNISGINSIQNSPFSNQHREVENKTENIYVHQNIEKNLPIFSSFNQSNINNSQPKEIRNNPIQQQKINSICTIAESSIYDKFYAVNFLNKLYRKCSKIVARKQINQEAQNRLNVETVPDEKRASNNQYTFQSNEIKSPVQINEISQKSSYTNGSNLQIEMEKNNQYFIRNYLNKLYNKSSKKAAKAFNGDDSNKRTLNVSVPENRNYQRSEQIQTASDSMSQIEMEKNNQYFIRNYLNKLYNKSSKKAAKAFNGDDSNKRTLNVSVPENRNYQRSEQIQTASDSMSQIEMEKNNQYFIRNYLNKLYNKSSKKAAKAFNGDDSNKRTLNVSVPENRNYQRSEQIQTASDSMSQIEMEKNNQYFIRNYLNKLYNKSSKKVAKNCQNAKANLENKNEIFVSNVIISESEYKKVIKQLTSENLSKITQNVLNSFLLRQNTIGEYEKQVPHQELILT